MIKKLWPYTKGHRKWIALGVFCAASEAVVEMILPLIMANIVDVGRSEETRLNSSHMSESRMPSSA